MRWSPLGARDGAGHFGDADVGQEIRLPREFGDIGVVELAAFRQRAQRLDALAQFLAGDEARIVRAQRGLQRIARDVRASVLSIGFAGLLRLARKQ